MNKQRRNLLLGGAAAALGLTSIGKLMAQHKTDDLQFTALDDNHEQWRDLVSKEAFDVLFKEATERPGTSELNSEKREGTFVCAACYLPLFKSEHKYESGTGWPSFFNPIKNSLGFKRDFKLVLPRKEYHCARCGGHQGHVFNDGPQPTGLRYCNNGVALRFVPATEDLPALRG